ncbi:MAG: hypothetical protein ACREV1_00895 [Gammaproteobacteria bacterium]
MLDLDAPIRTVAGVDLAADAEDPLCFYILPPGPQVRMVDGAPALELLRLVREGALSGGHLRLAIDLAYTEVQLEEARSSLIQALHENTVVLRPLQIVEASAEMVYFGRETDADGGLSPWLVRPYGRVTAGFTAPHLAEFSITLTPEGARMLESAILSRGAPIGVVYRLKFEGLWPAYRVLARVDWRRVYDHFSVNIKEGAVLFEEDIRKLSEALIETRAVSIQVVEGLLPEADAPAIDSGPALAWIQRELVERFCEPLMPLDREPAGVSRGTWGEILGLGSGFVAKKRTQIEEAVAEADFQHRKVLLRTLTRQAQLADLLKEASPQEHIGDAGDDHPFFARFRLHVKTARPLSELYVQELVLPFAYGSTRESIRLTSATPEGYFETWADAAGDRTWTLQPEVTFAGDSPLDPGRAIQLPALSGQGRELTLDLERLLGLYRIDIRGSGDPRVLLTRVVILHRRGAALIAEREAALAPGAAGQAVWFRGLEAGDRLEASTAYLLTDGRRIDIASFPVDTRVVQLPPPFPGFMTVQLIADDDWTDLERVIVAVQKQADRDHGTFVLDRATGAVAVKLELPDPAQRGFRYRVTRQWANGVEDQDDWIETEVAVVPVGRVAANQLVVEVSPIGPELPEAGIILIQVELVYLDPEHQVRDLHTHVIQARADRFRWQVAIADPRRRRYQYRVTVHRASGAQEAGPWTSSDARILPIPITKAVA